MQQKSQYQRATQAGLLVDRRDCGGKESLPHCEESHQRKKWPRLQSLYLSAKKRLRTCILKAKEDARKALCASIQENPWGNAYKIAMRTIGKGIHRPCNLSPLEIAEAARELFPNHPLTPWDIDEGPRTSDHTADEVEKAISVIKPKTAPGPDGISGIATKMAAAHSPDTVRRCLNTCWAAAHFPRP